MNITKPAAIRAAIRLAAQLLRYSGPERRRAPTKNVMFDRRRTL